MTQHVNANRIWYTWTMHSDNHHLSLQKRGKVAACVLQVGRLLKKIQPRNQDPVRL